jgi:hypothetical protein
MALETPVPKAYFPPENNLVELQYSPTPNVKGKAYDFGNPGVLPRAMVAEGGRKNTIRRKKRQTKKRNQHSSTTKRKAKAKGRTHKK